MSYVAKVFFKHNKEPMSAAQTDVQAKRYHIMQTDGDTTQSDATQSKTQLTSHHIDATDSFTDAKHKAHQALRSGAQRVEIFDQFDIDVCYPIWTETARHLNETYQSRD